MLRAAWRAHGGADGGAQAPFAIGLTSSALRRALDLADGMRYGQQLGAVLGYLLERGIHDASGVAGIEIDWVVYALRALYPLTVDGADNAVQTSAQRQVADGWKIAQAEMASGGFVVAAVPAPTGDGALFGTPEKNALQAVVDAVVATLDALADLGLSESMFQLAGANLERAAAATDMVGRAAAPPDVFDRRRRRAVGAASSSAWSPCSTRPARSRPAIWPTRRAPASRRPPMRSSRAGSATRAASSCGSWTPTATRSPRRR